MDEVVLKYVGRGEFFAGIPTRDLTEQDVAECGKTLDELIASGLYVTISATTRRKKTKTNEEE